MSKNLLLAIVLMGASQAAFASVNCLVSVDGMTFSGSGYDMGSALASARDACIEQINNGQVCVNAPFSCRDDGYAPAPAPAPVPQSSCLLSTPFGVFTGYGYTVDQALSDARNQCFAQGGGSECMTAPFSCRQ